MPFHGIGRDRLGKSLHMDRRHGDQDDALVDLGTERLGDEDVHLVEPCQALHARRKIHCAAEKREFPPLVRTHESRNPRAAVNTDSDGEVRQAFVAKLDIVGAYRFAH